MAVGPAAPGWDARRSGPSSWPLTTSTAWPRWATAPARAHSAGPLPGGRDRRAHPRRRPIPACSRRSPTPPASTPPWPGRVPSCRPAGGPSASTRPCWGCATWWRLSREGPRASAGGARVALALGRLPRRHRRPGQRDRGRRRDPVTGPAGPFDHADMRAKADRAVVARSRCSAASTSPSTPSAARGSQAVLDLAIVEWRSVTQNRSPPFVLPGRSAGHDPEGSAGRIVNVASSAVSSGLPTPPVMAPPTPAWSLDAVGGRWNWPATVSG